MAVGDQKLPVERAADEIELQVFATGRMTFADAVQQAVRVYPTDDRDSYRAADLKESIEEEVEHVWGELQRREAWLVHGYPFALTDEGIVLRGDWRSRAGYVLCLLLDAIPDQVGNELRYDFEEATGAAISAIFSGNYPRTVDTCQVR